MAPGLRLGVEAVARAALCGPRGQLEGVRLTGGSRLAPPVASLARRVDIRNSPSCRGSVGRPAGAGSVGASRCRRRRQSGCSRPGYRPGCARTTPRCRCELPDRIPLTTDTLPSPSSRPTPRPDAVALILIPPSDAQVSGQKPEGFGLSSQSSSSLLHRAHARRAPGASSTSSTSSERLARSGAGASASESRRANVAATTGAAARGRPTAGPHPRSSSADADRTLKLRLGGEAGTVVGVKPPPPPAPAAPRNLARNFPGNHHHPRLRRGQAPAPRLLLRPPAVAPRDAILPSAPRRREKFATRRRRGDVRALRRRRLRVAPRVRQGERGSGRSRR